MPMEPMPNARKKTELYFGSEGLEPFFQSIDKTSRRILVVTDTNTQRLCFPILNRPKLHAHVVPAGENSKNLAEVTRIWEKLTELRFDRQDLLINVGGGMVCDLGGYAASCFKRGIDFVNIPTSLLAMCDAAIGGKTGINFQGSKNQIGTFQHASAVIIETRFLATLPVRELKGGYAEVLKHHLIHDQKAWKIAASLQELPSKWETIIANAIQTKRYFTDSDPSEKGIRKALNFGHTIGHALESHFLQTRPSDPTPIIHGEAVAAGIACEAWLSLQRKLITVSQFQEIQSTLIHVFGKIQFSQPEIPLISQWAMQDKKNQDDQIRACLLDGIGSFSLDQILTLRDIEGSLLAYLNLFS